MNVRVALRSYLLAVVRDAPFISPQLPGAVNGGIPERSPVRFGQVMKVMESRPVVPWKRKPAVRFSWVYVFQKKDGHVRRLQLGLAAQAALAGRHRFGCGRVTVALGCGAGEK